MLRRSVGCRLCFRTRLVARALATEYQRRAAYQHQRDAESCPFRKQHSTSLLLGRFVAIRMRVHSHEDQRTSVRGSSTRCSERNHTCISCVRMTSLTSRSLVPSSPSFLDEESLRLTGVLRGELCK